MLDLSDNPLGRSTYEFLSKEWWPHPVHGDIHVGRTEHGIMYRCACGDSITLPMDMAEAHGLLSAG